jgi:hypothetical protein
MQSRLDKLKPPSRSNRRNNNSNSCRSRNSLELLLPLAPIQFALERPTN